MCPRVNISFYLFSALMWAIESILFLPTRNIASSQLNFHGLQYVLKNQSCG